MCRKGGEREMEGEMEPKAKLVKEICFISTVFASCAHLRSNVRKKVFVDWYLVLKVDENSGFHVIRGRYLQLALQLHPDKNNHPKAEVAFKLISEAYACLSDKARRKSFDAARRSNFCRECYQNWQSNQHINNKDSSSNNNNNDHENKPRPRRTANRARQCKILQALKQVQSQFREECCVIENCLKLKTDNMNGCGRESPLFDPYDHIRFSVYPYQRASMATGKPPENCFFQPEADCGQAPYESPIYQIRSNVWTKRTTKPLF